MSSTVVVCRMPDEQRILSRSLPGVLVLSGDAVMRLPEFVPPTCTRLLCMGVCGGLAPDLAVADAALAVTVVDQAGTVAAADAAWNADAIVAARKAGVALHPVPYYSSGLEDEADTREQRAALLAKYGAHAIDDEARFVVAEAQRRGIPFNVVRPVSDDWRRTLPREARAGIMNADGTTSVKYLLKTLQLADVPTLTEIAAEYDRSLDALEIVAKALADLIGGG